MKRGIINFLAVLAFVSAPKAGEIYLFYNAASDNLDELEITKEETAHIFDGSFGPASDELPLEVKFDDFYVTKYPDGKYVFILDAPFNCGQLGCNTLVYTRDADGDLVEEESKTPVKCKIYDADKLVCTDGGYKPEVAKKPVNKKKILHFPAPKAK